MFPITFTPGIRASCPAIHLGCLWGRVEVRPSGPALLGLIDEACRRIGAELEIGAISSLPLIRQAREAYKACGKKPGRYRPSAEALLRRVVSGKGLYQINNVVDVINYTSITTCYSIGGYDCGRVDGAVELGIGREGEPYQAIARGELNIAGLPALRDRQGAFGSPTSDSERTSIQEYSREIALVFFDFGGNHGLEECLAHTQALLERHCSGSTFERKILRAY